jgi:hypothetical protein
VERIKLSRQLLDGDRLDGLLILRRLHQGSQRRKL